MPRTRDLAIQEVTEDYLQKLDINNLPSEADISADLIDRCNAVIELENQVRPKGFKWQALTSLTPAQIADVIMKCYLVVNIDMLGAGSGRAQPDQTLLALYEHKGPLEGIYVSDDAVFRRIARKYAYNVSEKDLSRMLQILRDEAPVVKRTCRPELVPVANGVYNTQTKTLDGFSPDYVFIAKSAVSYNPGAANVVIHNDVDNSDWDVENWMKELSDDPEIVELFWKLIGAVLRPFVPWNKAAWLYSETGNNGKGTLCSLMRNLVGENAYASIPLSDFSKNFILEGLVRSSAIITDENDVGVFIDKAANLKAVITGDSILIDRKFRNAVSYVFRGMMVQCVNELPRVKDKSDSFYRRQLVIPFSKCFTGQERKYIKDDYLKRQDVLEYVMKRVLDMDYDTLPEPASCSELLTAYKEYNDPVRQFIDEILPQCRWDLLPFSFLYDLYKAWFKKTSPSGQIQGRNTFTSDLMALLYTLPEWTSAGTRGVYKSSGKMDGPEPLIIEYDLKDWMNPNYSGADMDKLAMPAVKSTYRGLLRQGLKVLVPDEEEE